VELTVHLECSRVAQVPKPAVSPISKSAAHGNTSARWEFNGSRIWKSAIQPTWKSALRGNFPETRGVDMAAKKTFADFEGSA